MLYVVLYIRKEFIKKEGEIMSNSKRMLSMITALAMTASAFSGMCISASAEETVITPSMTYVDYSNPETAVGYIEESRSGYNKISGGSIGFGNTGWGVNYVTFMKIDASAITDTITGATLTFEGSGSSDSKRKCTYGAAYTTVTDWDNELTYNTANEKGMLNVTTVGATSTTTSTSATGFESISIDIKDAFKGDADKIVTIAVYETAPAGGYIKTPSVTIQSSADTKAYSIKYVIPGVEEPVKVDSGSAVVNDEIPVETSFDVDGKRYYAVDGTPTSLQITDVDSANNLVVS